MAAEGPQTLWAFPAGADLSASAYRAVALDASGQIVVAGAGSRAIGILADKPRAGEHGSVVVAGVTKAEADAAIAPGDYLSVGADGKVVPATTGTPIIGQALEGAAAGEFVTLVVARGVA